METKYDLHGYVNHYGGMQYGHYTSCVKNPFDEHWYKYDDARRLFLNSEEDL